MSVNRTIVPWGQVLGALPRRNSTMVAFGHPAEAR